LHPFLAARQCLAGAHRSASSIARAFVVGSQPQPRRLPTGLASRWQAAGPAGRMLVASAAQGVHSQRACGTIAFDMPLLPGDWAVVPGRRSGGAGADDRAGSRAGADSGPVPTVNATRRSRSVRPGAAAWSPSCILSGRSCCCPWRSTPPWSVIVMIQPALGSWLEVAAAIVFLKGWFELALIWRVFRHTHPRQMLQPA
jgi:hypothetical protein